MTEPTEITTIAEAEDAFKRSRGIFYGNGAPGTIERARTLTAVCTWTTQQHKACGTLRLTALRELGRYLANTPRLKGRPKKESGADTLPSLADLGVDDRHVAADALKVFAVSQRVFDDYMQDNEEPSFRGLMRAAQDDRDRAGIAAMAEKIVERDKPGEALRRWRALPVIEKRETVKKIVATAFHPTTDMGTRDVAIKQLVERVPDIAERVLRQPEREPEPDKPLAMPKRYTELTTEIEARDTIISDLRRTYRQNRRELSEANAEHIKLRKECADLRAALGEARLQILRLEMTNASFEEAARERAEAAQ